MKRMLSVLVIFLVLAAFIIMVGCTKVETVYICANGRQVIDQAECSTNKVAAVKKQDAESYARNFVNAYFISYSGKVQFVSSYLDADVGDYKATFIVSEKDGSPVQTKVLIDGVTGEVRCMENCEYVGN